jgi:hypothetical protein
VGVLAEEQRLEAARLERARELGDVDAVVGRKIKGANQHEDASADFEMIARERSRSTRVTISRWIDDRNSSAAHVMPRVARREWSP